MKYFLIFIFFCTSLWAETIGHDTIGRSNADGANNIVFIDPSLVFTTSGKIHTWSIYGTISGWVSLQVYRSIGGNQFTLVGENELFAPGTGLQNFSISEAQQINVQAGDMIGWNYHQTNGIIHFDNNTGSSYVRWVWNGDVNGANAYPLNIALGQTITVPSGSHGSSGYRIYSIQAYTQTVPELSSLIFLSIICAGGFLKFYKN